MAGSYLHVIYTEPKPYKDGTFDETDMPIPDGNAPGDLLTSEDFPKMIENLGDAYEAIEELYGMVWSLAIGMSEEGGRAPAEYIEWARQNYKFGLDIDVDRKLPKDIT